MRDGQPPSSIQPWGGDPSWSPNGGMPAIPVDGMGMGMRPLPPALANRLDAGAVFKGLRRHWVLAMTLGALCSGAAALLVYKLMPASEFTVGALLRVHPEERGVLGQETRLNTNDYRTLQKTQETLIKSRNVLNTALGKTNIAMLPTVKHLPDPVDWLERQLRIDFQGEIMTVNLSGAVKADLPLIVNSVVDTYKSKLVDNTYYERRDEYMKLKELLEKSKVQLKATRDTRTGIAKASGAGNEDTLKEKHKGVLDELADVKRELWFAKSELRKAEIEFDLARRNQNTPAAAAPAANDSGIAEAIERFIDNDPDVMALEQEIAALQEGEKAALAGLRPQYANRDPQIRETRRQIKEQQAKLDLAIDDARARAEARAAGLASGTAASPDEVGKITERLKFYNIFTQYLNTELAKLEKASEQVNKDTTDLSTINDEIAVLEEHTQRMDFRVKQLESELEAPVRVELIEHADEAKEPDGKRRFIVSAGAGMGTLAFVLLAISFLEYRVRRIDSPDTVTRGLGMRIVGALPATPNRSRFALPGRQGAALQEAYWRSRLNESVNAIRTLMLRHSQNERLQVVMVTSASVGEGKTSLSCHLATSLARAGRKTLLLDCDLRNPTAHRVFDLPLEPGMCEVLRGQVSLEEVSHPIALGDLRMITAGKCDLIALQALGTEAIGDIIARLRPQYDFIVVDTPPVLPVADPLLIGQHVDAALFSILRDVSRAPKVHDACERLANLGIRILGAVVAGTPLETSGSEYYYTAAYVNAGATSLADDDSENS